MATRAMFPAGVFSVGGEMVEDEGPSLSDLPGNNLPVPQLVMLANAATAVGGMESAAEDGASCDGLTEEKDMVELKTVGCTYSDSEGESVRYSYDQQNRVEFCIVEYVDSPGPRVWTPAPRNKVQDDHEAAEEEEGEEEEKKKEETKDSEEDGDAVKDLSKPQEASVPDTAEASAAAAAAKRRSSHAAAVESAKKKKPFHCKPCNYQAENEEEFVAHLGTHAVSKRMVLNRVEGRSKAKGPGAGGPVPPAEAGGGDEADSKGVIRCERCGYNTNRYDHYVAHLKHHSKEGEDQRVFKCTLCPYTTVSQYHWRKHLRNHFPSKLHTCDQCSYFSDRKSNYIQHIRKHTGMRPFRCPYCDYSSSQKTHLTRHMRTHSGERPFKCDTCNYLAANQHEVTRHARQVHNGPKPLACPYCLYKTADRSNFKKHVELHLNPRQFHCPLCKYAASKKCNLQYHIKSRHVGCDIPIDVSKVKLRVKKGGEDSADPSGRSKADKVRGGEDDDDEDDDDDGSGSGGDFESDEEYGSKLAAAPIAPSAKKGGGHTQAVGTDGETDRGQRKAKTAAAVKDKGAVEGKEKAVRKVTTRQRKVARAGENTKEKCTAADGGPAKSRDPKAKRSARKKQQLPKETPCVQEAAQPDNPNEGQVVLQRSIEEMKKLQKERRMEKVRKAKQEEDKPKADVKTNKRLQSRRTGAKKPDKGSGKPVEDVSVGNGPEESPEVEQPARKVKVGKRRAIEALDLSTKHSAATPTSGLPSPKRSKTSAANKPATKPSLSKTASETPEPGQAPQKEEVKLKKTRKTNKKTPVLQDAPASPGDTLDSVTGDTSTAPTDVQRSPPETQSEVTHPQPDSSDVQKLTKPRPAQPKDKTAAQETAPQETEPQEAASQEAASQEVATQEAAPPAPEKDLPAAAEVPSRGSGPGEEEETPCAVADRPPAPTFRRPGAKAPRPSLELPRPAEEDEGIHSSHEGASDASDCASEGGSEDSGLNSAGAGSGKMANDPETPTDEIPTPTELKCHLCVFCDRTFPLEVEYRRHLNRHLVNVYYPAEAGK